MLTKISKEIEITLKRLIRLSSKNSHSLECKNKDFEYYLTHFKLKKLDSFSLKEEQINKHHNLRKDDFEVFFRETCYFNKNLNHLRTFEPVVKFLPIKSGLEIWKNSKINLQNSFRKIYENSMKRIKTILNEEKQKCEAGDLKQFKEYFKSKYIFYYNLKKKYDQDQKNTKKNLRITFTNFDIVYPPLIISLNSEIRFYIKELCDYFNIKYDISIDKGKVLSYSIDSFFTPYFNSQCKNFTYNPYEIKYSEIAKKLEENSDDISIEDIHTEVLRRKYSPHHGFVVNQNHDEHFIYQNSKFFSQIFIKKANWIKYICFKPEVDHSYSAFQKQIDRIGHIDSLVKFEIDLIDTVDINTITRIIDDYTGNISSRITNTVRTVADEKEDSNGKPYSPFRNLVKEIVHIKLSNVGGRESNSPNSDVDPSYASNIEGDLLKYFLMLRFLKMRDYKFFIINLINYFRFIQKKFTIDLYRIENKNWKKKEDLNSLSKILSGNIDIYANTDNIDFDLKSSIEKFPLSEYSQNNPIIPLIVNKSESTNEFKEFNQILLDEIDEIVEYSDKVVRVKDSKGNNIIYDASLSDMKQLELEMAKIATFFIQKSELLVTNTENIPNPIIDRSQVILDLFVNEFEYLNAKFELVSELVTCYDNTNDVIIQKSLMQLIIDTIAKRPLIEMDYNYFTSSYKLEIESLRKRAALYHILVDYQKKQELNENKQLFESLDRYYWMLSESALEIIKHIRLDKQDVEMMKKYLSEKTKSENEGNIKNDACPNKYEEISSLLNIFAKLERETGDFEIKENFENNRNDKICYDDIINPDFSKILSESDYSKSEEAA